MRALGTLRLLVGRASREGMKKAFAHGENIKKIVGGGQGPLIERWIMVEKIINIYSMLLWSFHIIFIYAFFFGASFETVDYFFAARLLSLL